MQAQRVHPAAEFDAGDGVRQSGQHPVHLIPDVAPDQRGRGVQEHGRIGDVLHHLHVDDHVEARAGRCQVLGEGLGAGLPVVDGEPAPGGMQRGDLDVRRRGVDAHDLGAEARQRLGEQAAAAADIQKP